MNFGKFLGKVMYCVKSIRKTAIEGLTIAYSSEKTQEEIISLAKQTCKHWGISIIEFMRLPKIRKHNLVDKFIDAKEPANLIKEKLKLGKGCIVITGHFGMWEYIGAGLSYSGVPLSVIMRPLDNTILDKFVSNIRASFGTKNIPKKQLKSMLKSLKNNEALVFLIDQNSISKSSVFVPFFNKLASTSTGATYFLSKYKDTPVVFVYPYRDENYVHRSIAKEIPIIDDDDNDAFTYKNMAYMTKCVEDFVRMRPEQWLWLHPRWRKRPPEEEQ